MLLEMKVKGLMLDPLSKMPIVILRKDDDSQPLPIWVGIFEANAIALELENIQPPRPMTHDLMKNMLQTLKAKIEQVVITDLKENTYYAEIHIQTETGRLKVDSRPSDAIALALRTKVPILVEERVMKKSETAELSREGERSERLKEWLESLEPEDFGEYKM